MLCSIIRCFGGELEFSEIFCYSDSQICLSWIKATHKEYKTFVENRVREIRSAVPPDKWYYCPSDTNPADIITRSNVKNLSNTLWMNGPPFLHDSEWSYDTSVPRAKDFYETDAFVEEVKSDSSNQDGILNRASIQAALLSNDSKELCLSEIIDVGKYSDLLKLIRIIAYVIRFVSKLKGLKTSASFYCTAEEMRCAKMLLIKENQRLFKTDINYKELCTRLNIQEDDDGILRVQSRLKDSYLPFAVKTPIVLKSDHILCQLFIFYHHKKVLHNGMKQTITEMRSCFFMYLDFVSL